MKMAKKLLAVVLTGVMALSMLTGCALSDKIKANALEDALNSDQVKNAAVAAQTNADKKEQEENTKYDYKSELNSIAGDAWKDENCMKSGKADDFATYVGELKGYAKNTTTNYFVYVIDVTDVKTSKKGEWTTRAVDLRKAVTNKGFDNGNIKDSNSADGKYTAKFGIDFKSVTTEEGNKKTTTDYAIIVFEAAPAAAQ